MSLTISLVSILLLLLSDMVTKCMLYLKNRFFIFAQAVTPRLKGICDFPLPSQVIGEQTNLFSCLSEENYNLYVFVFQLLIVALATSLSLPFQLAEVNI